MFYSLVGVPFVADYTSQIVATSLKKSSYYDGKGMYPIDSLEVGKANKGNKILTRDCRVATGFFVSYYILNFKVIFLNISINF